MRINKYLARSGIASRRKSEIFIINGRIKVNNKVVKDLSTDVKKNDKVTFDGLKVKPIVKKIYYIVNKPKGYTSTVYDPHADKIVMDLIDKSDKRGLFPVGRLDKDSRGLMIITNDGDLANKVMQSKFGCEKQYIVTTNMPEDKFKSIEQVLRYFKCGTLIENYKTKPSFAKVIGMEKGKVKYKIILKEGKKRQIRKLFQKAGIKVIDLQRVRIGKLKLGDLKEGDSKIVDSIDKDLI